MAGQLAKKLGFDSDLNRRWTEFWIPTWQSADSGIFFEDRSLFTPLSAGITELEAAELYEQPITGYVDGRADVPLSIFCAGEDINRKSVLELGVGCGWVAKRMSHYTSRYAGFGYSKLAVAIGNAVCADKAQLYTFEDIESVRNLKSAFDTVIARFHFVHCNMQFSVASAKLAHMALKKGGKLHASFFRANEAAFGTGYRSARSDYDLEQLTVGYDYTRFDIEEVGQRAGLRLQQLTMNSDKSLSHVVFQK